MPKHRNMRTTTPGNDRTKRGSSVLKIEIFFVSLDAICTYTYNAYARMKKILICILLIFCGLLTAERSYAQYYSWGADPTSFKWRQMRGEKYRVVYPDTARNTAERMMYYLDAVSEDISYGYIHPQMSIPFVVHPENMLSNGLVMWLPKRVEFLSTPLINGYSMPWVKQLVAHEYRHAVQYNNLNRGIVKALSYIIGQQSSTIGLLFMPLWMMEGDAVMNETEMSTFGRGLQPSFSMGYRAYGDITTEFKSRDKWFCGSYKDYIPSHYNLGYFMCRYGYSAYGAILGNDMAEITARRPWMVVSNSWVFKKLYGTTQPRLFSDTFRTLNEHWMSLPDIEQTTEQIAIPEPQSYTTYSYPMATPEGKIIALKEDLDTPQRFVVIDPQSGKEQRLYYTGIVSTRPMLDGYGRLWWTEYRRSPLFAQKVASKLYFLNTHTGKKQRIKSQANILYPTPTLKAGIAWVEFTADGTYHIVHNPGSEASYRISMECGKEVHGLAWDNATEALYILVTDDDGMHIARIERDAIVPITRPAYTTLSDLNAKDGKLYFGSIASGRDELHCLDIATNQEYQLSESSYGSFSPAPYDSERVVATSYDKRGYLPVMQRMDSTRRVEYRPHPEQQLLPQIKPWGVVNLDTVRFDRVAKDSVKVKHPERRFSRIGHAINIHSWAPASYNPYEIVEESKVAFNLGATIIAQNLLSTAEGFLTWGWNRDEGSVFKGTFRYYGLGVSLWFSGTYGGTQNVHTIYYYDPETQEIVFPHPPKRDRYYSLSAGATLPLLFQRGYHTSQLTLSTAWNFSNGMTANVDKITINGGKITNLETIGYSEGVHQLSLGVGFSDQVRMSHRDFLPPWAVALSASYTLNPTTDDFGHLAVLYGKVYTPGFAKHHSLSLAASYQTSIGGFQSDYILSGLAFKSTRLLPRGFSSYDIYNKNYFAASLNYQLPVCYPDGGWGGVIYFKRIRLNIGGDYASFRKPEFDNLGTIVEPRRKLWAYGGDIIVDFNLFSMPHSATMTATLSLYGKGSNIPLPKKNKFYVNFGLGLPF